MPGGFSPRTPLFHVPDPPRARHTHEGPTRLRPAGGKPPPGPPSCRSCSPRPGRGEASPRTPLVPDPPPPHHDQFQNTLSRIAKNRHHFFFYKLDTRPRRTSPGPRPKKKKNLSSTFSATPRNVRGAPPRQIHKRANMFWKELSVVFFKIGGKKTPPLKLFSFFLP